MRRTVAEKQDEGRGNRDEGLIDNSTDKRPFKYVTASRIYHHRDRNGMPEIEIVLFPSYSWSWVIHDREPEMDRWVAIAPKTFRSVHPLNFRGRRNRG